MSIKSVHGRISLTQNCPNLIWTSPPTSLYIYTDRDQHPSLFAKKKHSHLSLSLNHQIVFTLFPCIPELANPQESSLEEEEHNTSLVKDLYEALSSRDVDTVQRLLAPDIEWWFHGPPCHQHLMRILTGAASPEVSFDFEPLSIVAFGSTVLVEGYDKSRSVSWVQAWTIADGIITQVREYFNTSLTVARFGNSKVTSAPSVNCQSIWESKFSDNPSMPGLVLAL